LGSVGRDGGEVLGAGRGGSGAGDFDLGTLGVELRGVGLVEGQQLVADEVVAGLEAGGDLARPLLGVVYDAGSPVVAVQAGTGQTLLIDLEPLLLLSVARAEAALARVHPHHHRSLLVRPLRPDGRDVRACGDLGGQRGRGAAVAGHLRVGDRVDGVIVRPLQPTVSACPILLLRWL
jgi:hypothetical protein